MLPTRVSFTLTTVGLLALGLAALTPVLGPGRTSVYGIIVVAYLLFKVGGAMLHRDRRAEDGVGPRNRAVVVVPFYNEDPTLLGNCVRSVMAAAGDHVDAVHVIDDGSSDPVLHEVVRSALATAPDGVVTHLTVHDVNLGKREALARAVEREPDADVFVTIDSDTVLDPDSIDNLLAAFDDPDVTAATGLVLALNHDRNLLTRLIDLRYANAFLVERAAYSRMGSVLCACGSLAGYRGDVMRDHLDDFVNQTFLGQPAVFGDDRRMTNYALQHGKAVFQSSARAQTAVPERFGHYVRQQVRWNKSFFRESLWAVANLPGRSAAPWLSMFELVSWMTFTVLLVTAVVVAPFRTGQAVAGTFLVYVSVMAWVRSLRYMELRRERLSSWQQASVFLLSPIYGLVTLVFLLPLRLYSLMTLRQARWGTRSAGVEVALDLP